MGNHVKADRMDSICQCPAGDLTGNDLIREIPFLMFPKVAF